MINELKDGSVPASVKREEAAAGETGGTTTPLDIDVLGADPDKPFVFSAYKVIANDKVTPDQVSATIPDTGLKSNLADPATDTTNVQVHTTGSGEAPRTNGLPHHHNDDSFESAQEFFSPEGGDDPSGKSLQATRSQVNRRHSRDFPDAPKGDDDPAAAVDPAKQEGATGRGPGGHEEKLSRGIVEGQESGSPTARFFADGEPMSAPHDVDSARGELGRTTVAMPAIKQEEPPGPRNEISLDPRIVHLQVGMTCSLV